MPAVTVGMTDPTQRLELLRKGHLACQLAFFGYPDFGGCCWITASRAISDKAQYGARAECLGLIALGSS
jgi:hypothetical protein